MCVCVCVYVYNMLSEVLVIARASTPLVASTAASVCDLVLKIGVVISCTRDHRRAIGVAKVSEVHVAKDQNLQSARRPCLSYLLLVNKDE